MSYLNITKDLNSQGRRKVKLGQVLIFDFEGSPVHLKIMRKTKDGVWAKRLDSDKFITATEADEKVTIIPKS